MTAAGVKAGPVTASRGVRLIPDREWAEVDRQEFDAILIPGGMEGTRRLMGDERILTRIRSQVEAGRWVGALCAGPLVLQAAGVLTGRRATCHPGVANELTATPRRSDRVVTDGRVVTSQGPGTTFEFALEMIRHLAGADRAKTVESGLMLPPGA